MGVFFFCTLMDGVFTAPRTAPRAKLQTGGIEPMLADTVEGN